MTEDQNIAIIGMSCRFPGADHLSSFWDLLLSGRDPMQEVPADRWNIDDYYDPNPDVPGKMITREGGFISSVDQFDAAFFSISPREANQMDPQQRILLELTWHALEHAGIPPRSLKDSQTGIFVGLSYDDYEQIIEKEEQPEEIDLFQLTGNLLSAAAGRLAYFFGVHGQSMSIDTSTSSSMVAIHNACQNLRDGDCSLAIAAGINLILSPSHHISLSKARVLAKDGRCKTFDAKADGYGRSDGCGVVVLKRLKDALRDRNPIYAVIKSSTVNQDGASSDLVAPSQAAQADLIKSALTSAQVEPSAIAYLEAHGTGTPLGDSTEIQAIKDVFGSDPKRRTPLWIGSGKSNIGHTEAASGVAGLIKTILSLYHEKIPGNLHFIQLNPKLPLDAIPARVINQIQEWPKEENHLRLAGVTSLGFTGTNGHLIIEEAPHLPKAEKSQASNLLFTLSAKTAAALDAYIEIYKSYLANTTATLEEIVYGAACCRQHFEHRLAVIVSSNEDLLDKLNKQAYKRSEVISWLPEAPFENNLEKLADLYLQGHQVDWRKLLSQGSKPFDLPDYPFQRQHFWSQVLEKSISASQSSPIKEAFSRITAGERHEWLLNYLRQQLQEILGLSEVPTNKGFFDLGMTSLTSIELGSRIQTLVGPSIKLSETLALDYPSIDKLANYLETLLSKGPQIVPLHENEPGVALEEPIAIIGMSCRLPGNVNTPEAFWELLIQGKDAIEEVPSDRWDIDAYYDPDPDVPGKMISRYGGFVHPIDQFDAAFFGISPREAEGMDPQQRITLETAWEAIQRSGIDPHSLSGSQTGVFIGVSNSDYLGLLLKNSEPEDLISYLATGNSLSAISGRLSYILGLQGPAISLDTACSSSLVAIHEACQSLHHGECSLAIAGGVNIILLPELTINYSRAHMLAKDGHCKTFDSKADGYVRSEGCGILVLKPLNAALRDNNPILAVIKGSHINQDGSSSGLTVPNRVSQEALLKHTLELANLTPDSIQHIEAHGTGTSLGDPIEMGAILDAYGKSQHTLYVSSVKTYIGHLESAAGVAGVMKTVLSLIHKTIPKHLHFETLNPKIHLENSPIQIPLENTPWPEGTRHGAVSSFGSTGTNAHLILAESPIPQSAQKLHPTTTFQRKRFWADSLVQSQPIFKSTKSDNHPFLLQQIQSRAIQATLYESNLTESWPPFIAYHKIYDLKVVAGAVYISAALSALQQLKDDADFQIEKMEFSNPLILRSGDHKIVQTILYPEKEEARPFEILTAIANEKEAQWTLHVSGNAKSISYASSHPDSVEALKARIKNEYPADQFYSDINETYKIDLKDPFKWIEKLYIGENECLSQLRTPKNSEETEGYVLYPGCIDSFFHLVLAFQLNQKKNGPLAIPFFLERFSLKKNEIPHWVHASIQALEQGIFQCNFTLYNIQGEEIGRLKKYLAKEAPESSLARQHNRAEEWLYQTIWKPLPLLEKRQIQGEKWLILKNGDKLSPQLTSFMQANRCDQVELMPGQPYPGGSFDKVIILWPLQKDDLELQLLKNLFFFMQDLLGKNEKIPPIFIVSQGLLPYGITSGNHIQNTLRGFFKTLALEFPSLRYRLIDLDPAAFVDSQFETLVTELSAEQNIEEIAYRDAVRYAPHLEPLSQAYREENKLLIPAHAPFKLDITKKGSLKNLVIEPTRDEQPGSNEISIEVEAAGINFRDVLNALGLYPGEAGALGLECAGKISAIGKDVRDLKVGDRVVGFATKGAFSTQITEKRQLFTACPDSLKLEEAAALPIVFATAYHCLVHLAQLKPGEKVLIHAAAGGVGLAAIQIAQTIGAEIYATAGSEDKAQYLRSIGVTHIYHSRSLDFAEKIFQDTQGTGVDVVLNSLTGEGYINKTVQICAKEARFIEISKINIWSTDEMKAKRPDIHYTIFALDEMVSKEPERAASLLLEIMEKFNQGIYKPIHSLIYGLDQAMEAFSYLQHAKQIGKVVMRIPSKAPLKIHKDASYLMTGGLGALGLLFVQELIQQGANHVVITSRRTPTPEVLAQLEKLKRPDVVVEVVQADVADSNAMKSLIGRFGSEWPKLRGVIHAAGVLEDGIFTSQTWEQYQKVLAPKVLGGWNLHQLTRQLTLDFFILFSSIAARLGSGGQSNYAAANAYLDGLAYYRRQIGLPALSIAWGPWAGSGMAAQLTERHLAGGWIAFTPDEGLEAFYLAARQTEPQLFAAKMHWEAYFKATNMDRFELKDLVKQKEKAEISLIKTLEPLSSSQRKEKIVEYLLSLIKKILHLSEEESFPKDQGFFASGMDSLTAMELRNKLQLEIGEERRLPTTLAFDCPNTESLGDFMLGFLFSKQPEKPPEKETKADEKRSELEKQISEMSLDDLNKLIGE